MLGKWRHRLASCYRLASPRIHPRWRPISTHVSIARGDDLGPTHDNAHQTFRVRRDGTGKDLPLPPLLDPIILEKRSLWETTKAQPEPEHFTPFQKKLQANPFGLYISNMTD